MLAAGDCAHAQLVALSLTCGIRVTLASLIVIDADSGPLESEKVTSFQRLGKESIKIHRSVS